MNTRKKHVKSSNEWSRNVRVGVYIFDFASLATFNTVNTFLTPTEKVGQSHFLVIESDRIWWNLICSIRRIATASKLPCCGVCRSLLQLFACGTRQDLRLKTMQYTDVLTCFNMFMQTEQKFQSFYLIHLIILQLPCCILLLSICIRTCLRRERVGDHSPRCTPATKGLAADFPIISHPNCARLLEWLNGSNVFECLKARNVTNV